MVPAGVRRFAAPSEGDSIFNNDLNTVKDRLKGIKGIKKKRHSQSIDFENPQEKFRQSF